MPVATTNPLDSRLSWLDIGADRSWDTAKAAYGLTHCCGLARSVDTRIDDSFALAARSVNGRVLGCTIGEVTTGAIAIGTGVAAMADADVSTGE